MGWVGLGRVESLQLTNSSAESAYCGDCASDLFTALNRILSNYIGLLFDCYPITDGLMAEWLACWTQAQKAVGSNRSRDAVG